MFDKGYFYIFFKVYVVYSEKKCKNGYLLKLYRGFKEDRLGY